MELGVPAKKNVLYLNIHENGMIGQIAKKWLSKQFYYYYFFQSQEKLHS